INIMKVALIAAIFLIAISVIAGYFLFFGGEVEEIVPQTTTTLPQTTTTLQTTTTTVAGRGGRIITVNEVFIYSDRFEPSQLAVKLGEKVKWINKDNKPHTLVCFAGEEQIFGVPLDAMGGSSDYFDFPVSSSLECWDIFEGEQRFSMNVIVE
ncbi:MAG: hypothetical protein QXL86_03905, partial [Candidatus Aenigmatarchaeota archaeon]